MGIDISAYKKATFVREDGDEQWPAVTYLYANPDFPGRADGMKDGLYDVGGHTKFGREEDRGKDHQLHFRAGSYSGYCEWLRKLCWFAHGCDPSAIWKGRDMAWAGKPFVELINFADNEGLIGPQTSAKLARDFQSHGEAIKEKVRRELWPLTADWFCGLYDTWQKAFELAAGEGCVHFH